MRGRRRSCRSPRLHFACRCARRAAISRSAFRVVHEAATTAALGRCWRLCRRCGRPATRAACHRYRSPPTRPTSATSPSYLLRLTPGALSQSPFAGIQPVGRPSRGKKQLRFDEAERFITTAFQLFDERQDTMALAAATALLLGCRASEVLQLRVRDLDCGGTKLWVAARDNDYQGKTANAARDPDVPAVLRPRLLKLTADQAPDAYLFGLGATGKPRSRQLLHSTVQRLCVAAEVPVVCTHSLRGVWATAGVRSGALSHAVAAALGHGSFAVTAKHYVKPGAPDGTRTEREPSGRKANSYIAGSPPKWTICRPVVHGRGPDKEQAAVVIAGSQRTEHLVGRLGVGPVRGPHSHRLGGSQGVEAEAGEFFG